MESLANPIETYDRRRTSGTNNKHSRRSPAPACANRPIANATVDRVHPRLVPECVLRNPIEFRTPHLERRTPHEKTPPGHSSASPDTPRDSLARHADDSERPQEFRRKKSTVKFSEPCGTVHPRTDFPPTQISLEGSFFRTRKCPQIATGRSRCARCFPRDHFRQRVRTARRLDVANEFATMNRSGEFVRHPSP